MNKEQKILYELIGTMRKGKFAEKHGIRFSKLSKWLSGKVIPKRDILEEIAKKEGYRIEETLVPIVNHVNQKTE